MARVEIKGLAIGVVQNTRGDVIAGTTFTCSGTVYAASTGGTTFSGTQLKTNVDGEVPGWLEPGVYTIFVPITSKSVTFEVGGVAGADEIPAIDARVDSLESSSATAAARIAVLREAPINLKDPQYGAIGDGSSATADTAALAAAKAAISNTGNYRGGTILVPPGDYRINTGLNADDSQGLIIEGVAGRATNQPRLLYTPSTGSLVTGKSSQGLTLRNLRLEYSHASYAGELLNFDHSALATDVFFLTVEDCWIGGVPGVDGARSLLRLNKTIISKVRGNRFIRAEVGVRGRDPDYSVAIDIEAQNEFNELSEAGVHCPGESWTIDDNTFEPTAAGAASGISTDLAAFAQGLNITGNWFGDVTTGAGTWIKAKALGGQISGNRMATPGPDAGATHMALHACEGLAIAGNRMEDGTNGASTSPRRRASVSRSSATTSPTPSRTSSRTSATSRAPRSSAIAGTPPICSGGRSRSAAT